MSFLEVKKKQIEKEKNELTKLKQKLKELNYKYKSYLTNSQNSLNEAQLIRIKPLDSYKSPTLIGLNNIGGQYIMNPILQCLSQTKRLIILH